MIYWGFPDLSLRSGSPSPAYPSGVSANPLSSLRLSLILHCPPMLWPGLILPVSSLLSAGLRQRAARAFGNPFSFLKPFLPREREMWAVPLLVQYCDRCFWKENHLISLISLPLSVCLEGRHSFRNGCSFLSVPVLSPSSESLGTLPSWATSLPFVTREFLIERRGYLSSVIHWKPNP